MRWSSRSGPRLRPVQYEAQGPDRGMPRTHEGHNNRPQLELPAMELQTPPIGQRRAFSLVGRPVEASWSGRVEVVGISLLLTRREGFEARSRRTLSSLDGMG